MRYALLLVFMICLFILVFSFSMTGLAFLEQGMDCSKDGFIIVDGKKYDPVSCSDIWHVVYLDCIGGKLNVEQRVCLGTSTCYEGYGCFMAKRNWVPYRMPSGFRG